MSAVIIIIFRFPQFCSPFDTRALGLLRTGVLLADRGDHFTSLPLPQECSQAKKGTRRSQASKATAGQLFTSLPCLQADSKGVAQEIRRVISANCYSCQGNPHNVSLRLCTHCTQGSTTDPKEHDPGAVLEHHHYKPDPALFSDSAVS